VIALLKLLLVFAGIVLLLSRKWDLGPVLLLASVAVSVLFAYPLLSVVRDVLLTAVDLLTLQLALAVVLIMALAELLRQTAGLKGMVEGLQALVPDGRIVIAALPALVGLLPMVGGAMFSAPLVDAVGDRLGVDGTRKTFVNYWFRHLWEPVFPFYPSVLLAAALLGLTTAQLARATWPLTAAALAGGLLFGLLRLPRRSDGDPSQSPRLHSLRVLAASIWPILLVIALSLILPVDERARLLLGLSLVIALTMAVRRVPLRNLGTILRRRIPWKTVVVIFSALVFRRVLDSGGVILATSDALIDLRVPTALVAFAVPFIVSLLTGVIAAAYSIGFPVVLPLILAGGGRLTWGWIAWLMAGGYLGLVCSPMHLCLVLTRVYFKAEWGAVYRLLVPSALLVLATAIVVLLLA
jgi:integral membrane protein (TIGR00529 family)